MASTNNAIAAIKDNCAYPVQFPRFSASMLLTHWSVPPESRLFFRRYTFCSWSEPAQWDSRAYTDHPIVIVNVLRYIYFFDSGTAVDIVQSCDYYQSILQSLVPYVVIFP